MISLGKAKTLTQTLMDIKAFRCLLPSVFEEQRSSVANTQEIREMIIIGHVVREVVCLEENDRKISWVTVGYCNAFCFLSD